MRPPLRALGVALVLALAGCYATAGYDVPFEDDYGDEPPPAFIATSPVYYYEGRPAYWYHDHWHFREGGHWRHYRGEPAPLRGIRPPVEPGRPVPMGRGRVAPMGPAPARAPGALGGRGRPSPRMWERPGRLQR